MSYYCSLCVVVVVVFVIVVVGVVVVDVVVGCDEIPLNFLLFLVYAAIGRAVSAVVSESIFASGGIRAVGLSACAILLLALLSLLLGMKLTKATVQTTAYSTLSQTEENLTQ